MAAAAMASSGSGGPAGGGGAESAVVALNASSDDIGVGSSNLKALDTPRTREACKKLGLVLEDLQIRPEKDFYIPGDAKELQRVRFDHYEKRRKERLAHVLAERAKVIANQAKKGEVPGVQSGQFLSMLENLFEKEAKRLEHDLKGRLRQHGALVKENEDQLRKEQALQQKMSLDFQKRISADEEHARRAKKVGEESQKRHDKSKENILSLHGSYEENQKRAMEERKAEAERMLLWEEEDKRKKQEKADMWEAHHQSVVSRIKSHSNDEFDRMQRLDEELAIKQKESELRRDDLTKGTLMRYEEKHMHLMDVRNQKSSIDRVEEHRRAELREQSDSKVERIETLLAVKDQLLEQRRGRNAKTEASKGSRGLNLRRDCLPGPGQYEAPRSCLTEATGACIDKAQELGMVQQAEKAAKLAPPPGTYDTDVLANGDRVSRVVNYSVTFGTRNRDSYLDDAIRSKAKVPAPGTYDKEGVRSTLDPRAPKFRRERITDIGLDKKSAKRIPVWARPATDTPGPAGYNVDDYTRKEVLRRAQRSLPNLMRDMLRPPQASQSR